MPARDWKQDIMMMAMSDLPGVRQKGRERLIREATGISSFSRSGLLDSLMKRQGLQNFFTKAEEHEERLKAPIPILEEFGMRAPEISNYRKGISEEKKRVQELMNYIEKKFDTEVIKSEREQRQIDEEERKKWEEGLMRSRTKDFERAGFKSSIE